MALALSYWTRRRLALLRSRTVPVWDASFNVYLEGTAVIKVGSTDVAIADVRAGRFSGPGKPIKPAAFWFKANDTSATNPLTGTVQGDDPSTILYFSDVDTVLSLFIATQKHEPILVGTRRPGSKTDRIFPGPSRCHRKSSYKCGNAWPSYRSDC